MKKNKWNRIIIPHAVLLLWALLFIVSIFANSFAGFNIPQVLSIGSFFFLFVNIPLSVFSLMLKAKDYFSFEYDDPIQTLSILNIIIGCLEWIFVILLLLSPK